MNKPPAFQFYVDDFIGGTVGMTAEECGAYIRLLCFQWGHGQIPSDSTTIGRIAGCHVSDYVLAKFPNGKNARLESERIKQIEYRAKKASAGRVGGKKRWHNHSTPINLPIANDMANDSSPSPVSNISTERKKFTPPSLAEVKLYAEKAGIIENDALWFWQKMEAQDWFNGKKKCKSWGMTLCSWKTAGYLPSQKNGMALSSFGKTQQPMLHGNWKDSL